MTGAAPGGGTQRSALQRLLLGTEAAREYPKSEVTEGTYLQKAGVKLFQRVLWFTAGVGAVLFGYLYLAMPDFPKPSGTGALPDTVYVHLVAAQRAQVFSNFLEAGSRLLLNLCLPLLSGILGYIFGQRS